MSCQLRKPRQSSDERSTFDRTMLNNYSLEKYTPNGKPYWNTMRTCYDTILQNHWCDCKNTPCGPYNPKPSPPSPSGPPSTSYKSDSNSNSNSMAPYNEQPRTAFNVLLPRTAYDRNIQAIFGPGHK